MRSASHDVGGCECKMCWAENPFQPFFRVQVKRKAGKAHLCWCDIAFGGEVRGEAREAGSMKRPEGFKLWAGFT